MNKVKIIFQTALYKCCFFIVINANYNEEALDYGI